LNVLVDTSVWSLALRRNPEKLNPDEKRIVQLLERLIRSGRVVMTGPIRQEVLSGIRNENDFERLKNRLAAFNDIRIETRDYETAARFYNQCRSRGFSGSPVDLILCAVAHGHKLSILTLDTDFDFYAKHLSIKRVYA